MLRNGRITPLLPLAPISCKNLDQTQIFSKKIFFPAVGEIGLDFYWSTEFIKEQYEAFGFQMEWALQNKLPVVIHTRNAMRQTIDFVKSFSERGLTGIFHCFGGSYEDAVQIIDMNFYLGIKRCSNPQKIRP